MSEFESYFNQSPCGMLVLDENGNVINLNEQLCLWLGITQGDTIGKNIFMLRSLPKESKVRILEKLSDRMEEDHVPPYTLDLKTKKGEKLIGSISETIIKGDKGKIEQILVVITDVTDLLSGQGVSSGNDATLDKNENFYKTIVEHSAVAIMMANDEEKIISWNNSAEKMLDMTKDDLFQRPVSSLYQKDEWEKIQGQKIRDLGMVHHIESKMVRKSGEVFDVDVSITLITTADGSKSGSIGVIRDTSERKKLEKQVKEAAGLKSDFVSMVSHELKTPITSIQGSLGIVLDGSVGELNDDQKDFLDTASRNLGRLDRLISDVLDYQKLSMSLADFEMAEGNINSLVERIKEASLDHAKEKEIEVELDLADDIPIISYNHEKIEQVLENLVENGIKFTDEGSVTIKTAIKGTEVVVSVKDSGIGIKDEDMNKLYQIFSQISSGSKRMTGSTGLGLAISKIIIEKHNGKIWAESKEGEGSTFSFSLPLPS